MPKLKWILCSPLALLLLWMSPSRLSASGDTPIIIKDGGSIILWIQKLDSDNWTAGKFELRHPDTTGTISSVKVTEAGADKCNGDSKCGIDVSNPWRIQVNYGPHSLNLSSVSANKGIHIKFSKHIPFPIWKKTANPDEREFGHGDGNHITGITVNGQNLCAGRDGCSLTVVYTVQ